MNSLFNLWLWAALATAPSIAMAFAMSRRYESDAILWAGLPLLGLISLGLALMAHRSDRG